MAIKYNQSFADKLFNLHLYENDVIQIVDSADYMCDHCPYINLCEARKYREVDKIMLEKIKKAKNILDKDNYKEFVKEIKHKTHADIDDRRCITNLAIEINNKKYPVHVGDIVRVKDLTYPDVNNNAYLKGAEIYKSIRNL